MRGRGGCLGCLVLIGVLLVFYPLIERFNNNDGQKHKSSEDLKDKKQIAQLNARTKQTKDQNSLLGKIADNLGETKTYVVESLLEYAIRLYEKEGGKNLKSKDK